MAETKEGRVAPALGRGQIGEEAARIALEGSAQPERVVDLVGVAVGDVRPDPLERVRECLQPVHAYRLEPVGS